jgi:hypothetical protein
MSSKARYKGFVIDPRCCRTMDGSAWSVECHIEKNDSAGAVTARFPLEHTFSTRQLALEAALESGRRRVDEGLVPATVRQMAG